MTMKGLVVSITVLLALTASVQGANAQAISPDSTNFYPSILLDGEYVPYIKIQDVVKVGKRRFKNRREMNQYYRMIYNLKKTYPYAQIAKRKLLEINENLKHLNTERERREYIAKAEKELKDRFENELTKLTISQGRMLIKLIDRETGKTSYELVKELKGGFSAAFWQGVARIFGSNLKTKFDPEGEDKVLNELIFLYEQGLI